MIDEIRKNKIEPLERQVDPTYFAEAAKGFFARKDLTSREKERFLEEFFQVMFSQLASLLTVGYTTKEVSRAFEAFLEGF